MIRFILNSCRVMIVVLWLVALIGSNYGIWNATDVPFGLVLIFATVINGALLFCLAVPITFIIKEIENYRDSLSPKKEKPVKIKKEKPSQEDLFLSKQH